MKERVIVNGSNPESYKPKVLIARTILALSTGVIYPLFQKSKMREHGGKRELEAFRGEWLRWLNRTPRSAFLSYLDSYYAFIEDLESGFWCPVAETDRDAPRQTALNALKARWGNDRHQLQPIPQDFSER